MNEEQIAVVPEVSSVQAAVPVMAPASSGEKPAARPVPGADAWDRLELTGPWKHQAYAKYRVNEQTGDINVEIINAATDEVIREIPSQEIARITQQLQAYLAARGPRRS